MMEPLLNFVWILVAAAGSLLAMRRSGDRRAVGAIAILVAFLFPIISVTDDLASADASKDAPFAAVLATLACFFALVALSRPIAQQQQFTALAVALNRDSRSPPRG